MTVSPDSCRSLSVVYWSCSALLLPGDTEKNSWLSTEVADPVRLINGLALVSPSSSPWLPDAPEEDADGTLPGLCDPDKSAFVSDDNANGNASVNPERIWQSVIWTWGKSSHKLY